MVVYCDGAAFEDKGGCGAIFYDSQGNVVETISEPILESTNNVAEIRAVIFALELAIQKNILFLEVFTDSLLAVNLINGSWRCHKPHLKPLILKAQNLTNQFSSFSISHVYREFNQEADELSKKALNKLLTKPEIECLTKFEQTLSMYRKKKKKRKKENAKFDSWGVIRGVQKNTCQENKNKSYNPSKINLKKMKKKTQNFSRPTLRVPKSSSGTVEFKKKLERLGIRYH